MTPSQVLPREEEKMTNLDTIKAEAVAKLVELMTTSIKENERRDCPYCDFKPQSFRPGKSLVTHIASIHRDKYKTKIEQMGDLLLSEIDRAVGVVIREVNDRLDSIEVDLVESSSFEYDKGWHDCNLTWDLRIVDLLQKLSTLKEK